MTKMFRAEYFSSYLPVTYLIPWLVIIYQRYFVPLEDVFALVLAIVRINYVMNFLSRYRQRQVELLYAKIALMSRIYGRSEAQKGNCS